MFQVGNRKIGGYHQPYIIAEVSANHNGDLSSAIQLIHLAKEVGADAVKLQTYTADTITVDCDKAEFMIDEGLWAGQSLYNLYYQAHTPWEWHKQLFDAAKSVGIEIFSSPFDFSAVDFLDELGVPAFKIASFEAVDLPLVQYTASKGKPLIISTGVTDKSEIAEAIITAKNAGCNELALLLCVSGYPAPASDYNLLTIKDMADSFDVPIGLSDHTIDNVTAITAIGLGACIIEKHLTIDRSRGGPDDSFSLEPEEFRSLVDQCRTAYTALGQINYSLKSSERGNAKFRRSLYFMKDLEAGSVIQHNDVRSIRPGYGIAPKYLDLVVGKTMKRAVKKYSPVAFDDFS